MKIPFLSYLQKSFFLFGLLFLLTSCPERNRKILEASTWELEETPVGRVVKSSTERTPSLRFSIEESRFTGFGGCNQIMGTFKLDKKKIHIERIGGTKMNCPNMTTENLFISSLNQVNRFKLKEGKLILLKDKSQVLVFAAGH